MVDVEADLGDIAVAVAVADGNDGGEDGSWIAIVCSAFTLCPAPQWVSRARGADHEFTSSRDRSVLR